MSAKALMRGPAEEYQWVTTVDLTSGDLIQLPDGRAAVVGGLKGFKAGETAMGYVGGVVELAKVASKVVLDGGNLYWVRSAGTASPLKGSGGFFVGTAWGDAASTDTTVYAALNQKQVNKIAWGQGVWDSVIVKSAGTPSITRDACGSNVTLAFSATAEAQKVDALSGESIAVADGPILDARLAIFDIGDEGSVDFNVGLANATHASDADSITESCFIHLDGTALDIKAESDDGTTEVAATDTTVDAVDNTYFELWIDARNPADIQIYLDGVNVLPASVFKLDKATGPLKALIHMEKGANDTLADLRVEYCNVRSTDLGD